jgi:DNA-binding NtrC family response regulator
MSSYNILVTDDEAPQRKTLSGFLGKQGYGVFQAENGSKGLEFINRESVDLLLTDMNMPGLNGIELLQKVKEVNPLVEVIVMTAYGTIESAVEAMQKGAFTFVTKPIDLASLSLHIERALERKQLYEENQELKARLGQSDVAGMIVQSEEMREVLGLVARVAQSKASVLILGESGTGKELVAKAIHSASPRKNKRFVPVNIAAIPETLVESELFGHEKGSFTGASTRHIGRFEQAKEGTLFIDEVGEMSLNSQVKLLRVLQEGRIERVGSEASIDINVRVITATHNNLDESIGDGSFREDLFYRLNVVRITIPPLRRRKADIPPLVEHFLKKYSRINEKEVDAIDNSAMDMLMKYSWPGNVRELENAIESAVVLCRTDLIKSKDLPPTVRSEINIKSSGCYPGDNPDLPLQQRLEGLEKFEVLRVLEVVGNNRSEAARQLGMSEKNIRDRLKRWEVL